jgi:hypothetical protein
VATGVVDDGVTVELTMAEELATIEELAIEELTTEELATEELATEELITEELTELTAEELGVGVGVADDAEELMLVSSMKSVSPLGPPQISVVLPLQGMLQRPSVTGKEFAFSVFPQ